MVALTTSQVRRGLGVALVLGMMLSGGDQAQARRRHRHRHHHHHYGFYHYWPHYYWPPYYWPYTPYDYYGRTYAPSVRRRFPVPAFHLPGLFHYPGALAKDEYLGSAPEPPRTTPPPSGQKTITP